MSSDQTTESDGKRLSPGTLVGDHLVVRSILGQGGTAVVYEALHTRLGAAVALKVLDVAEPYVHDAAARMQREAEVCANLDDPHVPRVYDVGALPDGTPYLVMEKVSGSTLEQWLTQGRLRLPVILGIADELLSALEAVHRKGVVHRDIKPSNVMLKLADDGSILLRLMDFGVSKAEQLEGSTSPKLTRTGAVVGTPHYMAPEQITGEPIDARADLYAAGVVLYEMLTGRTPFEGATTAEIVAAVLRQSPPPLSSLWPEVPPRLERVVHRAMAARAADRYQTARELRSALAEAAALADEPRRVRSAGTTSTRRKLGLAAASFAVAAAAMAWPDSAGYRGGREASPSASSGVAKAEARRGPTPPPALPALETHVAAAPDALANDGVEAPSAPEPAEQALEAVVPDTLAPAELGSDAPAADLTGAAPHAAEQVPSEELGAPAEDVAFPAGLLGEQRPELTSERAARERANAEERKARARRPAPVTPDEVQRERAGTREYPLKSTASESAASPQPAASGVLLSDYLERLEAIQREALENALRTKREAGTPVAPAVPEPQPEPAPSQPRQEGAVPDNPYGD
jgi:serine/threonine-protein kinase